MRKHIWIVKDEFDNIYAFNTHDEVKHFIFTDDSGSEAYGVGMYLKESETVITQEEVNNG